MIEIYVLLASLGWVSTREIGDEKQLFIDRSLIEEAENVTFAVNRPLKTGDRCIVAEYPWEGHRVGPYNTVLKDGEGFRMWYDAIASDGSRWLAYAESKDGIHWVKPMLGLVPFGEIEETNILFPPQRSPFEPGCVFIDTNPNCPPEERYKLVCSYRPPDGERGTWVFASPDGLRWHPISDKPSFRSSDTNNICFFDDRIDRYVAYVRVWAPQRKVGRCEFDDLTDWGREEIVFSYDDEDRMGLDPGLFTGMDFYNSAAVKYPEARNVYLIFPTAYYHYRSEVAMALGAPKGKAGNDGPMEIHFAASPDGIRWTRFDRRPFIPIGKTGGWDGGITFSCPALIVHGDEVWIYYSAYDFTHGNYDFKRDRFKGVITRAVLRLDGFVSVEADHRGGEIITSPLLLKGGVLSVNLKTTAGGHLRVEIQNMNGEPIPGFSADECDPINGDYISRDVTWHGSSDVSSLTGRNVKLRFIMRDAKLFAFRFHNPM